LKLNPSLNILKWPKDEQIRRLEVKVRDIDLIKLIAREKIEKIIKQKYIPSDICDRFTPLRNYIKGCGALLVRYKCREFLIQLTITSANARIVIREEKSSIRETDQGKLRFVQEVMEKFFNEDDILLKTDYGPVARKGGLEGKIPKQTPTTAETEIRLRWYDTLYWWTDGEIACFWVCFSPGSSGGCVDQKNWFANVLSLEKGLRTKRGKLTQEMIDKVLGVKSGSKEIPAEVELFKTETLKKFPNIDKRAAYFTWPSAEKMSKSFRDSDEPLSAAKRRLVIPNWITIKKVSVTNAKRMAEKWIRAILKDSWIPDDIHSKLIALDSSDANDYDRICVRYEMKGYYIQIVQINPEIAITIKPTKPRIFAPSEVIDSFFTKSTEIKENTLSQPVDAFPSGSHGKPRDTLKKPEYRNQYWGHTYWWTNGESFAFAIKKFYGGKGRPVGLPKDWF